MKIKIEFITPVLGTLAGDPELATKYIASKHPAGTPQADEVAAIESIDEEIEKTATVFPRNKADNLILWDYQVKGFFKSAAEMVVSSDRYKKEELQKVRLTGYSYKRTVDKMVFVYPRQIILHTDAKPTWLQRSIRCQTPKGERIALAISECLPEGTWAEFEIELLNDNLKDPLIEWLNYGEKYGFLQWRNAGYGRFKWAELPA